MSNGYKSISVDSLALVDPHLDKFIWVSNLILLSHKESLENISQMTHIEFVMEINGCFLEVPLYLSLDVQSRFDDWKDKLLYVCLEVAEMLLQEGTVDSLKRILLWELNGTEPEVTLKTWVDNE